MSSKTMEQVRDRLRSYAKDADRYASLTGKSLELTTADELADAIDAHLAGMGEPMAWLAADGSGRVIDVKAKSAGARASATASATSVYSIPLYAAPSAPEGGA